MIAVLRLEAIGDAQADQVRALNEMLRQAGLDRARRALGAPVRAPWCAEIVGRDDRFGLARRFVVGRKDYRDANSIGSRGVMVSYELHEGRIYEVRELLSWQRERRYFARAAAGKVVEIGREEMERWLNERSTSTS